MTKRTLFSGALFCNNSHTRPNILTASQLFLPLLAGFLFVLQPALGQETKEIKLLNADVMKFDRSLGNDVKKLIGAVDLELDGAFLNCDSAYLFQRDSVEAFGHVYIKQGDTLHLYGDYLNYSANTKLAQLRKNVKLIDKESELTTNSLDFNLDENLGYYPSFGRIVSGENILTSNKGLYYTKSKVFHFQDSVVVVNPDYTIYSDTMKYHTVTKVTTFFGPTEIIGDSSYIYCEKGYYDTENDLSRFSGNALLKNQSQTIEGDSLFYDSRNGIGEAYRNVSFFDSLQNIILKGNLGFFQDEPETTMLTDSTMFIQILDEGDSLFMHSDTLRSRMDSTGQNKIVSAYYHVKMFSRDLQGLCDSLAYSFADSVMKFYGTPYIWSDENQLSSEFTQLFTKNRQPNRIEMFGSSFIISKEDTAYFNQIKGKNMVGHFRDNEIYRIDVSGNGQSIYFASDEGKIVGMNKAESSDIVLYLRENKIEQIKFLNQPDMLLIPKNEISTDNLRLEGFQWKERDRPLKVADIFK